MPTRWGLFAGAVVLVTVVFLALARATSGSVVMPTEERSQEASRPTRDSDRESRATTDDQQTVSGDVRHEDPEESIDSITVDAESPDDGSRSRRLADLDSRTLLVDAVISQGLVGFPLVAITWYAQVPASALGLSGSIIDALVPGAVIGFTVYLANEAGAVTARRLGVDADERLRELLAPQSRVEWGLLLFIALPLIAAVEEFLFRAALIGGLSAGYDLPIWGLAVLSSIAFGLGHGLQGAGGVLVAGVLGFALAAAFVVTGSLWVVIVAHYVVNALEFVVHEGLGVEFGSR